tara:strand:+ start:126 stop:953 length:828 start_codon:yes stop_codon:yes gene_type:complete
MTLFHPFVLDNAAGQETVVGIGSDSEKYGVGISSHIHITGIQTVDGFLHAGGGIKDTSGDMGNSGQVLSSTGSGLNWINPGDASVENASNIGVNVNSTNADQFVAFVGSNTGNNPIRVDAGLKYNPSSNVLTVGTIAATNIQGTLTAGGAVPSGGIIIWSGAANAIPSGWVLCNGQNSTPDLRDRFVVGAGSGSSYSVGNTGGANSVTLTTNQIPSHTHSYVGHTYPGSGPEQNQSGGPEDRTSFNVNKTTGSTGSGQSHENRPPYYALCYIMKT